MLRINNNVFFVVRKLRVLERGIRKEQVRLENLNTRTGPSFLNRFFSRSVLHQSKISRGFIGERKLLDYLGDHNICGIDRARAPFLLLFLVCG